LEIEFKRSWRLGATIYLPQIDNIGDSTEEVWRNLLAFEECYAEGHPLRSYFYFMDDLVDTEEDVSVFVTFLMQGFLLVFIGEKLLFAETKTMLQGS
jgi:hypothetical protein